jgi:hypothetical protein
LNQEAHISRVEWSALLYQRAGFGKANVKYCGGYGEFELSLPPAKELSIKPFEAG